eukprot:g3640.t1
MLVQTGLGANTDDTGQPPPNDYFPFRAEKSTGRYYFGRQLSMGHVHRARLALFRAAGAAASLASVHYDMIASLASPFKDVSLPMPRNCSSGGAWAALDCQVLNWASALGDVNGDGKCDLIVAAAIGPKGWRNISAAVHVFRNNGTSSAPVFEQPSPFPFASPMPVLPSLAVPRLRDVDSDGRADLIIGVSSALRYFRHAADGTFVAATGSNTPFEIGGSLSGSNVPTLGDINGDGLPDLAVSQLFGGFDMFWNEGGPSPAAALFVAAAQGAGNTPLGGIAPAKGTAFTGTFQFPDVFDIDRDGRDDLVVLQSGGNKPTVVTLYLNVPDTTQHPAYAMLSGPLANPLDSVRRAMGGYAGGSSAPCFGDVDGDSRLDVVFGEWGGQLVYFRGEGEPGAPSYVRPTEDPFSDVQVPNACLQDSQNRDLEGNPIPDCATVPALGDVDGDGDTDLVVGTAAGGLYYYRNDGGRFKRQYGQSNPFDKIGWQQAHDPQTQTMTQKPLLYAAPALANITGSALLDLVLCNIGGAKLYRNVGLGGAPRFDEANATLLLPASVAAACRPALGDVDGDGWPDLVLGRAEATTLYFLRNDGAGRLVHATSSATNPFANLSFTPSACTPPAPGPSAAPQMCRASPALAPLVAVYGGTPPRDEAGAARMRGLASFHVRGTNAPALLLSTNTGDQFFYSYQMPTCELGCNQAAGRATAQDCLSGTFCGAESAKPAFCPAGFFCGALSKEAAPCPAGSFCRAKAAAPEPCPAGMFCPSSSSKALVCPAGFYCPSSSSKPISCPPGSFCPDEARAPIMCPAGRYCPAGASASLPCEGGKISKANMTRCVECPAKGVVCTGGIMTQAQGWWRSPAVADAVVAAADGKLQHHLYRCGGASCIGSNGTAEAVPLQNLQCAPHYHGPVCALCEEGFKMVSGTCRECLSMTAANIAAICIFAFAAAAILVWLWRHSHWAQAPLLKITLGFFQLVSVLSKTFAVQYPETYGTALQGVRDAIGSIVALPNVSCAVDLDHFDRLYMWTGSMLVVAAAFWAHYRWRLRRALAASRGAQAGEDASEAVEALWAALLRYWFYLAFFCYPLVLPVIIPTFICHDIDGTLLLRADYRLQCHGREFDTAQGWAVVWTVGFVAGMPLLLAWAVWRGLGAASFLTEDYNDGGLAPYWEVVELVKKLFLSAVILAFPEQALTRVAFALFIAFVVQLLMAFNRPTLLMLANPEGKVRASFGILMLILMILVVLAGIFAVAGMRKVAMGRLKQGIVKVKAAQAFWSRHYGRRERAGTQSANPLRDGDGNRGGKSAWDGIELGSVTSGQNVSATPAPGSVSESEHSSAAVEEDIAPDFVGKNPGQMSISD